SLYLLAIRPPPRPPPSPYTTLFRSDRGPRRSARVRSSPGHLVRPRRPRGARAGFPGESSREQLRSGAASHDHAISDSAARPARRSEEHTSELQSRVDLVCRLLLEKK